MRETIANFLLALVPYATASRIKSFERAAFWVAEAVHFNTVLDVLTDHFVPLIDKCLDANL